MAKPRRIGVQLSAPPLREVSERATGCAVRTRLATTRLAYCGLIGVMALGSCARDDDPRPNVLLLVLDAFRAERIGAVRGVPVAPVLTDLAARSRYFPRGITPCSWTKPAMASVLTALYADTHQVRFAAE